MNHNATCVFKSLLLTACLVFSATAMNPAAYAQFRSMTSGDWNNPLTWGNLNSVPGPNDIVTVMTGHTVTVTPGSPGCNQCRTLTVGRGVGSAVLAFASGSVLTVSESVTIGGAGIGEVGIISFANGGTLNVPQLLPGAAGAAQWIPGTGTVELTGIGDVVMSSNVFNSFNNVVINKSSGTVSVDRDILVSGNWTVNSAFNPQNFSVVFNGSSNQSIGGSVPAAFNTLVNSGAGLTLNQDVSLTGDWTNYAALSPGTRTVSFTGSALQQINGSAAVQFHTLVNDKTGSALVVNNSLSLSGNLTNNGALSFSGGSLTFNGSGNQSIGGTTAMTLLAVTVNKAGGILSLTDNPATINGLLTLTNGIFSIGNYDLSIGSVAGNCGSASSYICSDGSGSLRRSVNATNAVFPIGTATSYNPVTISNTGTRDVFAVSVKVGLTNALLNNAYVNREWTINENLPGGSNAQITLQWNAADELSGFNRTLGLSLFHYVAGWSQTSASYTDLGSGVYSASAGGFSSFSPFTIGNPGALPVELTSFTARYFSPEVRLSWSTATELNNYGFEVERSHDGVIWEEIGFVAGAGNSFSPKQYSFTDNLAESGKLDGSMAYRLRQIDRDGTTEYSRVVYVRLGDISGSVELYPAYPNPFNPSTTLSYSLPESTTLLVRLYNLFGQEVATLNDVVEQEAGFHTIDFNGARLSSGTYIVRFETPGQVLQQRIVLSK